MRLVIFCHSLLSDWNHGNAHFLRGTVTELLSRGHRVDVYEPRDAWSLQNLLHDHPDALEGFHRAYPTLRSTRYSLRTLDLDPVLEDADLVLVHEWNDPVLVKRVGEHRARSGRYRLLFHDTHHRCVTDRAGMARFDLTHYDGVLAFGEIVRQTYLDLGWAARAWTWHEAADPRVFSPQSPREEGPTTGDLVWIGNWGDEERTQELQEYLLTPVRELGLRARIHGVRYPQHALQALSAAGVRYAGWLPNYEAPRVFAGYRFTVHVPRRPYVRALPGIPTIRVFEALACGIPLISSPWDDAEGLFTAGRDFLVARNGAEMRRHMRDLTQDAALRRELARHGRKTVMARHTCKHRVDELMRIYQELMTPEKPPRRRGLLEPARVESGLPVAPIIPATAKAGL